MLQGPAILKTGESCAGCLLSFLPEPTRVFFDPCSNSLQLKRGFSNKSLVSNKSLGIPASIEAGKERNPPWQLPSSTISCRAKRKIPNEPNSADQSEGTKADVAVKTNRNEPASPRKREIPNEPNSADQSEGTKADVAFETNRKRTQFRSATAGCPPGPISCGTLRFFLSNWSGKGTEFNISALKFTDPCLLHWPLAGTPPESPASATAPCQKSGPRFLSRPREIRLRVAPPGSAVIMLLNLRDEEGWVRGGIPGCCLHPSFGF